MSGYRQILYHIVFRTKANKRTLTPESQDELYKYIWGIIKNKKGFLYRINGTDDHIHLLSDLHPSIALADLVRDIKTASSLWLKKNDSFPDFNGWSDGYAALTCSYRDKNIVIDYIKNQKKHQKRFSFEEEYRKLLADYGIEIDERYFP